MNKKQELKVFSGIRPSGKLHLGNYLGAIKNWIELQDKADQAIFAVVDYHGITTPYDPKTYKQQIMDVILDYLAAGVNPDKALLIRQSKIPQHTELAWLFNTITSVGWLDRLPTYKEQIEKTGINNMGLLDYPVLMAADILCEKSNLVPVGEDQLAHIDITNEIVKRFNSIFGPTFEPIKAYITKGARIMSLQDATKKMSKTGDEGIALSDEPDIIKIKIKKAVTDSGKEIKYDPQKKPAITNLLNIYHLLSNKQIADIEKEYQNKNYVEFKNNLTELIINFLKPFQEKRKELEANLDNVLDILKKSEEKVRTIANTTLKEIKEKMGIE
jgi:tryptophanyl-tRNA synthetase